jgi:hypothetical protein
MQQDPKKEAKDYEKLSVKDKLKQYKESRKAPLKDFKAGLEASMQNQRNKAAFEAAMQKERDFVLNRAKQRDKDPDWYKKEAISSGARANRIALNRINDINSKGNKKEYYGSILKELPSKEVKVLVKKESIGKEMPEKKYLKPRLKKSF